MLDELFAEAERQLTICNACRYCEGYCAVYPALERRSLLTEGDITHLANLCHDCRACFYACMYTEPHEFAVNPPAILSSVRRGSYRRYLSDPPFGGRLRGLPGAAVAIAIVAIVMAAAVGLAGGAHALWPSGGDGSPYDVVPYGPLLVIILLPCLASGVVAARALVRYWRETHGPLRDLWNPRALGQAVAYAGRLRYLRGGGDECYYPDEDPSPVRRRLHAAVFYGFLGCALSTVAAVLPVHQVHALHLPVPGHRVGQPGALGSGSALRVGPGPGKVSDMDTEVQPGPQPPEASGPAGLAVEANGINVIAEQERKGNPRDLFWPWCAANIAVLGVSYGSFFLGFGVSFWQATIAGVLGTAVSFLLVGFVSLAGKRGSAPTMALSRAAFGVRGNALPSALSYVLLVGWETVLCSLATLATATVFGRLGWGDGDATKVVAFLVVALVVVLAGILGFNAIMRLQGIITIATAVLTVGYIALTVDHISWANVSAMPSGSAGAFVGTLIFAMTGFGLGWVNSGADYSRYLPRNASGRGVVGWTTFGASVAPVVLVVFGLLLAGSDPQLNTDIGADPIGALTTILPTWYLVPFAIVAILGLIGGAVLDIYSSGLALLTLGLRVPRWVAAGIDGVIMIIGTIYVVWFAGSFIGPFQGFLITLGVPIAGWSGVFLADLALRRQAYAEADLYRPGGRYGAVNPVAAGLLVLGTAVGWGLVTNSAAGWLGWQGYLLSVLGLGGRDGAWAFANLGVAASFVIGFLGYLALGRGRVRAQEQAV